MGTRTLDESRWLLVDDEWLPQRDRARTLLTERRADVVAGSAPEAGRVLDETILDWLRHHAPHTLDEPVADADPLVMARRRVAEDLCILTPADDRSWVLTAGAVCFPSYWRLDEKLGRPLADVHGPVPGYSGAFARRVDAFLERLRSGQGVWRRNWSIHPSNELFVPDHDETPVPPPPERWLRSEHQTLRRLDGIDAIAFTIRTQQVPLAVLAARPDRCRDLAVALRGWTPGQRAYKGSAVDDDLLRWLDGC